MTKKLLALGLFAGMLGIAACEPREEPAFEDDFRFEEPPPATPAPLPVDTPLDPMWPDTLPMDTPGAPGTPGTPPGT